MTQQMEPFEGLTPLKHRSVKREYEQRCKDTGQDHIGFENRVWAVVKELCPSNITIGRDPLIKLPDLEYRPDVFALFDTFALIAEATYTDSKSFLAEELTRIEKAKLELAPYLRKELDQRKLVAILAIKSKSSLKNLIDRANRSDIKVIEEKEIDYYHALIKQAGVGLFYLFFSRVAPSQLNVTKHKVAAIRIKEGKRLKYIFSVNPHQLLSRAYISHRELTAPDEAQIGYQRMLKKKKLNDIAKYISSKHSFPAPIIVSFPKNAGEHFDPISKDVCQELGGVTLGHLHLPIKAASIYVVDGQHRLYGYTLLPRSPENHINVIAYKGLQPRQQGVMFVDINLKQTKVPSRLLWELYPDILSPEDDEYFKAVASRALERLIKSQLRGKVSHISSGSKGKMSFHALCTEVVKARLIAKEGSGIVAQIEGHDWEKQEDRLSIILSAFFNTLDDLGQTYTDPDVNNRFFLQNSGIIPLIRELGKACRHLLLHEPKTLSGSKRSISEAFVQYFKPLYDFYSATTNNELDELNKKRVGSSGFITTEDEMDDVIRNVVPSFPFREKRFPQELQKEAEEFVSNMHAINKGADEWIFREFDKDNVLKALHKPAKDVPGLEKFINVIYQEIFEASGGKSSNRACRLLKINDLNDIDVIKGLSLLRHLSDHKKTQIDPSRRRRALNFLQKLAGVQGLKDFNDLRPENCIPVQVALLKKIRNEFLKSLLEVIG